MFPVTRRSAALIAGGVALAAYVLSLWNGFAGDDPLVVRDNPATYGLAAAWRAWLEPYWPPPYRFAGLWRPLTVLSYGLDWSLAGGAAWWYHVGNVLLHGLATVLVVLLLRPWMSPGAALIAGLVFAVHPVHVEAVANVVGRAELLTACGLLVTVLLARQYRAAEPRAAPWWLAATLAAALASMLAKEHGVVAIALVAFDDCLAPRGARRRAGLYFGLAFVSIGWFFVWHRVAGALVDDGAHVVFLNMSGATRWYTMLPVLLEVLRLLAWPFELASDYAPQVVPVRGTLSAAAVVGVVTGGALVGLAWAARRRHAAWSFALSCAVITWAPTSNLLFPSGVILAERALYLAILLPAVTIAWAVTETPAALRRPAAFVAGAILVAFAVKTIDRIPFWRDPLNPIIEERAQHPENYRNRLLLGKYLTSVGDSLRALAEMSAGGAFFPGDPFIAIETAKVATALGQHRVALREAHRAYALLPTDERVVGMLVVALTEAGYPDSARAVAADALARSPYDPAIQSWRIFAGQRADEPGWRLELAEARRDWLSGRLAAATSRLEGLVHRVPATLEDEECSEIGRLADVASALHPSVARLIGERLGRCGGDDAGALR
jgi:hypothetical protein